MKFAGLSALLFGAAIVIPKVQEFACFGFLGIN